MIMAVKSGHADHIIEALNAEGIKATVVGRFTGNEQGRIISKEGIRKPLQHPGIDPYWKAFFNAFAQELK
jgi:hydrogenase expression/formation protein HypE